MARSMPHDLQPQPAPEEEVATAEGDMTLTVGHAGLASRCWLGARKIGSATTSNVIGARLGVVPSLRRAAPPREGHCRRPREAAEARFSAAVGEFLIK